MKKTEVIVSLVDEAPIQGESLQHDYLSDSLHCNVDEGCSKFPTTSPKETGCPHETRHGNIGVHFPAHFCLKKAKHFLHIHDEVDCQVTSHNRQGTSQDLPCGLSLPHHEHSHSQGEVVETARATSKIHNHHRSEISKLKSSKDESCGDTHHTRPAEAKKRTTSHGSSPKLRTCEGITKPSAQLVRAWRAFDQNKGYTFPQDWVRPILTREYTHCCRKEVVSHTFCDCCQKPECVRTHFFDNLVNPFSALANIFAGHKEEIEHHEKVDEKINSEITFSSIFGQTEELLPLTSESSMPIDIFGDQDFNCEFSELRDDKFCRQSCFKARKESPKSSTIQHEDLSWDAIRFDVWKESKLQLSFDGITNVEILRLTRNSSIINEMPRVVIKLTDLRNADSLNGQLENGYSFERQVKPGWTAPVAKFTAPSSNKCVKKASSNSSCSIQAIEGYTRARSIELKGSQRVNDVMSD